MASVASSTHLTVLSFLSHCCPQIQGKQAEGFSVVDFKCGTERDGQLRNLHYHVLLQKAA